MLQTKMPVEPNMAAKRTSLNLRNCCRFFKKKTQTDAIAMRE